MKYLKKFETENDRTSYENGESYIEPYVSYVEENNSVHYNKPVLETKLVVYYDIQDISSPTTICTNYDSSVKSIEVDGVLLDSVVTTYQFNSVGEHIIKYEFNNPTTVGNSAPLFMGIATIKRAVIADTFTSIGNYAFGGCGSLTSIIIGNNVTSIGGYTFGGCSGLTSVNIPNSVTSIGDWAFRDCSGLTSVTIGNSVTSIGSYAFDGCMNLNSITSLATTAPTISNYTFNKVKTGGTLTVPSSSTGYDVWMGTGDYYLGKYNWTMVVQ